jgi:Protein of unknown function (DUF4038)/Putative collagen-binding domain of a collagenase
MTWSAVGTAHGSHTAACSLSNQALTNLLVLEVINVSNNTVTCTGISGGGATWAMVGTPFNGSNNSYSASLFLGTVTGTGAQTATPTWSGTTPGEYEIAAQEFHSTAGSWIVDTRGSIDTSSSNANWASLTATQGAGELYWGFACNGGAASAGSTTGYVYNANVDTWDDGMAYNVNCPGTATYPVWGDTGEAFGLMVQVYETASTQSKPFSETGSGADVFNNGFVSFSESGASAESFSLGARYPVGLGGTPGAGWFVDQNGIPLVVWADENWGLPGSAGAYNGTGGSTWQNDMNTYLSIRGAQGVNAVYTHPFSNPTEIGGPNNTGFTWDNVHPFTSDDPSVGLNNTFWLRIDYLIDTALTYGITVFLCLGMSFDIQSGSNIIQNIDTTQAQAYGTAIGNRYKNRPNIFWTVGDDYEDDNAHGFYDDRYSAILTGLRNSGDTHPISMQSQGESTSRWDFGTDIHAALAWASHCQYQLIYSYNVSYQGMLVAYQETTSTYGSFASLLPAIRSDGFFLGEATNDTGIVGADNALEQRIMRNLVWWALASGSRGFFTGSNYIWWWGATSPGHVSTETWYASIGGKIRSLFQSLTDWHLLMPDISNTLVTVGKGSPAAAIASAGRYSGFPSASTDPYVCASVTSSGSLAVIYCCVAFNITIDQSKMQAGYAATWVDPANGTTYAGTPGSTYNSANVDGSKPASNSAGNADWVLVLQGPVALSITTASLPDAAVGSAYSQSLAATGGTAPYVWEIQSGSIPTGLVLS